jgi:uncharacterized surface protein with fasciclin (FAS1) repeats
MAANSRLLMQPMEEEAQQEAPPPPPPPGANWAPGHSHPATPDSVDPQLGGLAPVDPAAAPDFSTMTVRQTVQALADPELFVGGPLGTLNAAIEAANLVAPLNDPAAPHTLFAATNTAFRKVIAIMQGFQAAEDLLANQQMLTDLLLSHVVTGDIARMALQDGQELQTLGPEPIVVRMVGNRVFLTRPGDSPIFAEIVASFDANNGWVHAIDEVLVPQAMLAPPLPMEPPPMEPQPGPEAQAQEPPAPQP